MYNNDNTVWRGYKVNNNISTSVYLCYCTSPVCILVGRTESSHEHSAACSLADAFSPASSMMSFHFWKWWSWHPFTRPGGSLPSPWASEDTRIVLSVISPRRRSRNKRSDVGRSSGSCGLSRSSCFVLCVENVNWGVCPYVQSSVCFD